jgi:hypothetical protein
MSGKDLYIGKLTNLHYSWSQRHTQYRQLMLHLGKLSLVGTDDNQKVLLLRSRGAEYL